MRRHIYNWNIVACDFKQPISLTHSRLSVSHNQCYCRHNTEYPTNGEMRPLFSHLLFMRNITWPWHNLKSNFFSPPAHLCAVTYITEILLHVTLSNQSHSLIHAYRCPITNVIAGTILSILQLEKCGRFSHTNYSWGISHDHDII